MGPGGSPRAAYEGAAREYESRAVAMKEGANQIKQAIESYSAQRQQYMADMESKIAQVNSSGEIPPEQKAAYIAQIRSQYEAILNQIDEKIRELRTQLSDVLKNAEIMDAQARTYRRALISMASSQADAVHAESSSNRA